MLKRRQIPTVIAALNAYAERLGCTDVARYDAIRLNTGYVTAGGTLHSSGVEFVRRVERETGRPFSRLSAAEQDLWETLEVVVVATATCYDEYDDEGSYVGIDLGAYRDFVRDLARRGALDEASTESFAEFRAARARACAA